MKILLVEDDRKLAEFVERGLTEQGFGVDRCDNGDDALTLALTRDYDALVLDIMVPGRDGLSVLRTLRDRRSAVPVIRVSARSALTERLEGLILGAADYLTQPFYLEELAARLHALVRRASGRQAERLSHGGVTVDLITREVRHRDAKVELTAREYALLTYLLRSPGRVFSRTQICEHVWNYHFDPGTNLVDVYVQHLRKKLPAAEGEPPIIETVRGVGYRVPAEEMSR